MEPGMKPGIEPGMKPGMVHGMKHAAEVLWVARYDYKRNWVLRRHVHNYYQAILTVQGKGRFFLGQEEYDICPTRCF